MSKAPTPKKVIITGASGAIGQNLVPIMLSNGYEVQAVTRDLENARNLKWFKDVNFVQMDINQTSDGLDVNSETGIIHLAWQGLPNYKSEFHIGSNLPSNYNFLKALIERGARHVLVSGTCAEYGMQCGKIKSSAPTHPNTQYAYAKDSLHKQLRFLQQQHDFILKWARIFYIYDQVGRRTNSIISQLNKAIDSKEEDFNMSGGEQLRDYLTVEEVAQQLFYLFEDYHDGAFNICSGEPISIRRLVENHIKKRKSNIRINLGFYPYPDYEPMAFWGERDVSKSKGQQSSS
ncbi:NAD-dependent epimerase/dehydratase family protein [Rhodovulum kholense]|uniref:dTDP-6-deoxy-L-talose 4-dehydrogenase (NAD+) n=1 Tax=Rhodovulum kholense TaxID=453584 RepID=A0A8E2VHH5_9RHOB|nr:NAD(P)-dependent oxidoreductase [Rhodovulum kholense]PTW45709.1 dTDP-6-deoxy-L-talose 4-dehydrogenase (NAD+) [Rhodovulum kholense]